MKSHQMLLTLVLGMFLPAALPACALAQLVFPEVTVDIQNLPDEAKAKLGGLDSLISAYFSSDNQEWNRDEGGYDVPVQISIFFTEYNPNPQEDKYKANLIITNRQETRFDDKRWEFGMRQPIQFSRNQFNPFTGVLEFYVWMLIGMEEDKYVKLGGRKYFDKARQVVLQSTGSLYYFGWDKRDELLRNYVSDRTTVQREFSFFYYTGLYYDSARAYTSSKDYLYYALVKLEKMPIDKQREFFETNHRTFAEALKRAGYVRGIKALSRLDPAHAAVYDAIAPKEGNGAE